MFILFLVAFALALDDGGAPPLFAEDLRETLVGVDRSSGQFGAMVEGMAAIDRETFETTVADSLEAIADARAARDMAPPGDPELTGPMAILDEVLASWESGINSFHDLVLEAADNPLAVGLEIDITDSLIDLRAGDRLYQSFVASMEAADTPDPVVPYPEIAFVSESFPFSSGPTQIVNVARADGNLLALRPELAIGQVATIPEMVLNTNDQTVVPTTQALTLQVVVLNSGNTESEPVDVTIDLAGNDGSTFSQTGTAQSMGAGTSTTVEFVDIAVIPGTAYQLTIRLPLIEGDDSSEDNLREITFTVNQETTSTTVEG